MKAKRILALSLMAIMLVLMATPAYAGGHGNGKHSGGGHHSGSSPTVTWHNANDFYGGHYSNQCAQHYHVWHNATRAYEGHYAYECADYDHIWHSATHDYNGHYSFGCACFGHRK